MADPALQVRNSCGAPVLARAISDRFSRVTDARRKEVETDRSNTGMFPACPGWVPERSIGHAWKACVPQGTEGSNPSPSERALHPVRQIKYVAVHEMATILVLVAAGFGWGARFDFLYEPGGHWRWRGRTETPNGAPHWNRLLTTFAGRRQVAGENS